MPIHPERGCDDRALSLACLFPFPARLFVGFMTGKDEFCRVSVLLNLFESLVTTLEPGHLGLF